VRLVARLRRLAWGAPITSKNAKSDVLLIRVGKVSSRRHVRHGGYLQEAVKGTSTRDYGRVRIKTNQGAG
jgi:hypothetical protein